MAIGFFAQKRQSGIGCVSVDRNQPALPGTHCCEPVAANGVEGDPEMRRFTRQAPKDRVSSYRVNMELHNSRIRDRRNSALLFGLEQAWRSRDEDKLVGSARVPERMGLAYGTPCRDRECKTDNGALYSHFWILLATEWPSAHRFLHERADPCLVSGGQLLQREGRRPHLTFVETCLVAEA